MNKVSKSSKKISKKNPSKPREIKDIYDFVNKSLFTSKVDGLTMEELGLVDKSSPLANMAVSHSARNEFVKD
jgi:hypothetical protein